MGLASTGNDEYQRRTRAMVEATDMGAIEIDGAYPLERCVASNHAYMVGEEDSRHKQWVINNEMYAYLRSRGMYLNVPDWHSSTEQTRAALDTRRRPGAVRVRSNF